jgi:phosphohistidine phosphatase SixA
VTFDLVRRRRLYVQAMRCLLLLSPAAGAACASASAAADSPGGAATAAGAASSSSDATMVVYVVRHAERADTTRDPSLSERGRLRANALLATLRDAGIGAIVTTQYARTRETAAPLAAALGLDVQVVRASSPVAAHADSVARAAERLRGRGAVLVVGHSNTVPAIVAALGGPRFADLCDADYDNLFVVVRSGGAPARLARASFGEADDDAACAGMTPL